MRNFRSLFGWYRYADRVAGLDVQGELTTKGRAGAQARSTWWSPRPRNCTA